MPMTMEQSAGISERDQAIVAMAAEGIKPRHIYAALHDDYPELTNAIVRHVKHDNSALIGDLLTRGITISLAGTTTARAMLVQRVIALCAAKDGGLSTTANALAIVHNVCEQLQNRIDAGRGTDNDRRQVRDITADIAAVVPTEDSKSCAR